MNADDKVIILVVEQTPANVVSVEGGTAVISTVDTPSIIYATEQGPAGKPGPAIGTDKVSNWLANFGATNFNQTVPTGFSPWVAGAPTTQLITPSDVSISTPVNGDLLQYNGTYWVNSAVATVMSAYAPKASPVFTGTVKLPVYTLTTLPSASANTQCSIVVSNATGGPAMCISNGTNWINVRTNATVA